jgi:hypothetical protein
MDELISLVKQKTAEILADPHGIPYKEIVNLVEIRGRLLHALQETELKEEDRVRYREDLGAFLLQYDGQIIEIADRLKNEAAKHLKKISTGSVLRHGYDSGFVPDSLFYDKKK